MEKLSSSEVRKIVENGKNKSSIMVELYDKGMNLGEIAKAVNVRYQFVYNVISDYCRRNGLEKRGSNKEEVSKKDIIIGLVKEGKSNSEISKELRCNYNYVYKVSTEYLRGNSIKE